MAAFPTPDVDSFCDAHPQLLQKHVPRFFCSPARRMLPEAKWSFVKPDLTPLPRIGGAAAGPGDRPPEKGGHA